jgi:hypothetical protein
MTTMLAPATLNTPTLATVTVPDMPVGLVKLLALKGQFASLCTERALKVKKGKAEIMKRSTFVCRVGVNYDNISTVKEARANGDLPAENAGLPWGEWVPGLFPYVIAHKGCHYFRCTSVKNDSAIPKVSYTREGVEITKEEAKADALASEFYEKDSEVFTVKVESILEINGIPV